MLQNGILVAKKKGPYFNDTSNVSFGLADHQFGNSSLEYAASGIWELYRSLIVRRGGK